MVLRVVFRSELAETPKNIEALMHLDENEALRDPASMKKIMTVLGAVIAPFFVYGQLGLAPAFVALGGAAAAPFWVRPDIDGILPNMGWGILLFFAALFVTVGGLEASGVLELIAEAVAGLALSNLLVASVSLLFISAIASALVANIPLTIALVPMIQRLGNLGINASPLWWALALGAGFGGNGTIIGSAPNVVTVAL